jgi:hypothetical protein
MPIDSAAFAYQLSDLKAADRLAILRRAPVAFLDFELCDPCFRLFDAARPTRALVRTKHLPVTQHSAAYEMTPLLPL